MRVEPATRHPDRERVLRVDAARLDALVAEDAARVVAHVQVVVDLHRLGHRLGGRPVGVVVMAGVSRVALAGLRRRGRWAVAVRRRAVLLDPALHVPVRERQVDRRAQELQDHAAAELHALAVGLHRHAGLDPARAGGDQHARSSTSTTQTRQTFTGVRVLEIAQGRGIDIPLAAGLEDGGALGNANGLAVDRDVHQALRRLEPDPVHTSSGANTPRRRWPTARRRPRSGRARRSRRRA